MDNVTQVFYLYYVIEQRLDYNIVNLFYVKVTMIYECNIFGNLFIYTFGIIAQYFVLNMIYFLSV